uniref:Co-chaperone DjlA N-terminal domain-containing protein n=1 Tax=Magnetococcus massalia (strain MO-1) TaxID=451514 RepID=A0A1S7LEM5_MAGMO|nr:protein of unknown function [Candidatus Magnetococcus massalia]
MSSENMLTVSPVAASIYGFTACDRSGIENYAKALLTIAGADGTIAEEERAWFEANFVELLQLPAEVTDTFKGFDHRRADPAKLLSDLKLGGEGDARRMFLFDAIRMSKADGDYAHSEQSMVRQTARAMGVSPGTLGDIEGVVAMEEGVHAMRRALFRMIEDDEEESPAVPTGDDVIKHNAWITYHFGHSHTAREPLQAYCQLLLAVAGSDGEISSEERAWFDTMITAAGVPEDLRGELDAFDFNSADVKELASKSTLEIPMNMDHVTIYLAIQMASADGDYAPKEREAVRSAAKGLEVEDEVVDHLENLVLLEGQLQNMRKGLFLIK